MNTLYKSVVFNIRKHLSTYQRMVITAVVTLFVIVYAFSAVIHYGHSVRWHNQADYAYLTFTDIPGSINTYIDLNHRSIKINDDSLNTDLYMETDQEYEGSPFLLNYKYETINLPSDTPYVLLTKNTSETYDLSLGDTVPFEGRNYKVIDFLPYSEGLEDHGFREGVMVFSHDSTVSSRETQYLVFSKTVENAVFNARTSYSQSAYLSEYESFITLYFIGGVMALLVFVAIIETQYLNRTSRCLFLKKHGLPDRLLNKKLLMDFFIDYWILWVFPLGLMVYRFDSMIHLLFYAVYYLTIFIFFILMLLVYRMKGKEVYSFGKPD